MKIFSYINKQKNLISSLQFIKNNKTENLFQSQIYKSFAVGLEASKPLSQIKLEESKKIEEQNKLKEQENLEKKIFNQKLKEMGQEYKTAVYLWNSNASIKVKRSDIKNKAENTSKPQRIKFFDDKNIKSIYCGLSHTALITDKGHVYMFGENRYGQLGQGNINDLTRENPKIVPYLAEKDIKITKVCCTVNNTIALSEDGDVFSWGFGGKHSRKFAVYKSINIIFISFLNILFLNRTWVKWGIRNL